MAVVLDCAVSRLRYRGSSGLLGHALSSFVFGFQWRSFWTPASRLRYRGSSGLLVRPPILRISYGSADSRALSAPASRCRKNKKQSLSLRHAGLDRCPLDSSLIARCADPHRSFAPVVVSHLGDEQTLSKGSRTMARHGVATGFSAGWVRPARGIGGSQPPYEFTDVCAHPFTAEAAAPATHRPAPRRDHERVLK